MPRVKTIRQHDRSDCGPACLASVAAGFGLKVPLARIREYASTGRNGTNVLGLTEAAEKMGIRAKAVKGPFDALRNAPLPAIAHIVREDGYHHYVVLSGMGRKKISYMDPARGKLLSVSHEGFRKMWSGVLLILAPGSNFEKGDGTRSIWNRLNGLTRPFRKVILQALAGSVVYSLLGLASAVYVQKIMDHVLVSQNLNLLNLMSVGMMIILLTRNLLGYLKNLFLLKTGHQIDAGLLMGYYRHLLELPQRFFDNMKTGEILSRMNDAIKIRHFINHVALDLVVGLASILLTLLAMSALSGRLCLLVASAIPVYAMIFFLYDRINRVVLRRTMERAAELEAGMVESVTLSRTVREFNLQDFFRQRTERHFTGFLRSAYLAGRSSIRSSQATELVSGFLTVLLLWAGAYRVSNQGLTPGELMSLYTMLGYMLSPLGTLVSASRTFRDAGIAADRLFQILDLEREKAPVPGTGIRKLEKALEFSDVSFRYGAGPLLFKSLSFKIAAGSCTGIAGKNGSGKSSLTALAMALYEPQGGRILFDGVDIRHFNSRDLRKMVSIVPQQIDLFAGTLLENLAPGDGYPDMRRILDITRKTALDRLVDQMPEGFETRIGERGFNLSGGERQRLAIARALYREPSVLILDEATSALDHLAEDRIMEMLAKEKDRGITLVIISHKLQTLRYASRILYLEDGKVVEQGTHGELIRMKGSYHRHWKNQKS